MSTRSIVQGSFVEAEEVAIKAIDRGQAIILVLVELDDDDVPGVINEQLQQAVESLCEQGSVPITTLIQPARVDIRVTDIRRDL